MIPKASVIIPCYNHGHYLPRALKSVLAQTFTNWEAIIVDDGSTDNTREVAAQFTDVRIHYVYQDNRGLSAARNAGIRRAEGDYLAFLDADDEWEPCFLEVCQRALAAQQTLAAVVTLNRFIDESGAPLPQQGGQLVSAERFRGRLLEGGFFPPHAALVRAEAVRQAGLFDETLTSVEDWDLWLRITAQGGLMQSISEPLARYRVLASSMSTNAGRMHANRMAVLTKQFGSPQGEPATWSSEKRSAFAFAYRSAAFGYLQQAELDTAWRWMREAAGTWPPILERLDTFYELACGDQPKGYRGEAAKLDIDHNGARMLRRLERLFAESDGLLESVRRAAYGNAYLALAMLSDQAGQWDRARGHMVHAILAYPALVRQPGVVRRFVKLFFGRRMVNWLRRLTPRADGEPLTEGEA